MVNVTWGNSLGALLQNLAALSGNDTGLLGLYLSLLFVIIMWKMGVSIETALPIVIAFVFLLVVGGVLGSSLLTVAVVVGGLFVGWLFWKLIRG